jgi:hypothetical protein
MPSRPFGAWTALPVTVFQPPPTGFTEPRPKEAVLTLWLREKAQPIERLNRFKV